ncbi:MAG: GNAT family N-acetyltransferase [Anaerolineales bacterium]|nr:GNAT family N-acetyltransferase [Chloroflexota bacterium]MBL6981755.1 GNAT family N-acetyltransferase [Anaerolineales bacterium]
MKLSIEFLVDYPNLVSHLATWFYEEWGRRNPVNSLEKIEQRLQGRMNRDSLPITLIGFLDGKLVASASIKICEMVTHPQYKYWLGAVYVDGAHRGKGFGSQIVLRTALEAKRLGVRNLYLYTRSHEDFYSHLDWKPIERPHYRGREVVIMKQGLN